jgi:hypothetical protein
MDDKIDDEWNVYLGTAVFKSEHTIKAYKNAHKRLTNYLDMPLDEAREDEIIDAVNILSDNPNTQNSLVAVALVFRKLFDKPSPLILKKKNELTKEITELRIKRNADKKETLPSINEIHERIKELYTEGDLSGFIALWLMVTFNTRNADINLQIVKSLHETKADKKDNYLVIRKDTILFIRNNYKTRRAHGVLRITITDTLFNKAVKTYVRQYKEKYGKDKPVYLLHKDTKRFISSSIGNYIKSKTPGKITEVDINKIQVSNIKDTGDYDQLKLMSLNRGTSVENLIQFYNLDIKNFYNLD